MMMMIREKERKIFFFVLRKKKSFKIVVVVVRWIHVKKEKRKNQLNPNGRPFSLCFIKKKISKSNSIHKEMMPQGKKIYRKNFFMDFFRVLNLEFEFY